MSLQIETSRRPVGWMGIHRGHKARPVEWLAEKLIFLVSLSAILVVFLIFLFVAREALPIFMGKMNSAAIQPVIPPEDLDKLPPARIQEYLGITPKQFKEMDREALRTLMEIKVEAQNEIPAEFRTDKDARV